MERRNSMQKITKIITEYEPTQDGKDLVEKGYNPAQIIATANKPSQQPPPPASPSEQKQPITQPSANTGDKK